MNENMKYCVAFFSFKKHFMEGVIACLQQIPSQKTSYGLASPLNKLVVSLRFKSFGLAVNKDLYIFQRCCNNVVKLLLQIYQQHYDNLGNQCYQLDNRLK